ncbi:lytic transglycosylase domain-containing protein [Peribacillus sp. SCS-155]|uniref:lytic transglycosylase domain-containing protein n=1 Tax=Peribacillus sedimenti TaxID=3115297 RepID=UPI003906B66B
MKLQDLKVLMEIQSLQNLGGQKDPASSSGGNLFQTLMNEVLEQDTISPISQKLGGIADLLMDSQTFGAVQSLIGIQADTANDPSGQNSLPLSIKPALPPLSLNSTKDKEPSNFEEMIDKAAGVFNIPAKLIKSVIKHESNFNPKAASQAGAAGLMQLMPGTARELGVTNRLDPMESIMGGSKYLKKMMDRYNGDIKLALAAYNAGPGNVDKYGGIPPFKETQRYVEKIMDTFYS